MFSGLEEFLVLLLCCDEQPVLNMMLPKQRRKPQVVKQRLEINAR